MTPQTWQCNDQSNHSILIDILENDQIRLPLELEFTVRNKKDSNLTLTFTESFNEFNIKNLNFQVFFRHFASSSS